MIITKVKDKIKDMRERKKSKVEIETDSIKMMVIEINNNPK